METQNYLLETARSLLHRNKKAIFLQITNEGGLLNHRTPLAPGSYGQLQIYLLSNVIYRPQRFWGREGKGFQFDNVSSICLVSITMRCLTFSLTLIPSSPTSYINNLDFHFITLYTC